MVHLQQYAVGRPEYNSLLLPQAGLVALMECLEEVLAGALRQLGEVLGVHSVGACFKVSDLPRCAR